MKNVATQSAFARPNDSIRTPRGAPLVVPNPVRRAVLFALFLGSRPTASILRALALARVLDADLHVVCVLPEPTHLNTLFPQNHVIDAMRTVERIFRASRATKEWLRSCLGDREAAVEHFIVAQGNFVDQVALNAASLDAVLIIIPPHEGRMGSTVTSLVCTSGLPVFVAREPTKDDTIIAATDLECEGYPVLRQAAELGLRLEAPVIALHNVNPLSVAVGVEPMWPPAALPGDLIQAARFAQLSHIADTLPVHASAAIRGETDAVDAILSAAREQDADLIVVGTRKHGWLGRLFAGSVAAEVVDCATRSVLVTPMDQVEPLTLAPVGRP